MAETATPEPVTVEQTTVDAAAVDMVVENFQPAGVDSAANGGSNLKRAREDDEEEGVSKMPKVDEEELNGEEKEEEEEEEEEEEKKPSGPVKLGPKSFDSSMEMFDYFYNFLHVWPPNVNLNKYEHMVLLELLKNGHVEPDKKIGGGVLAFQVRKHPMWKSRCFFLIREDESIDDFSFRKCVDHILPLPEEMQLKPDVNRALGGPGGGKRHGGKGGGGCSGRGGGGGRGRGHGRRGKSH